MIQKIFSKYKFYFIAIPLGALAGYLYWRFIGCTSGSCPITSKWYNSVLFGMLFGALLVNKKPQKNEQGENGKKTVLP